jgi:prepilin-type N-terminal cleavage/methylation domain-containing protein
MQKIEKKGFTLLEILLVIAAIGILAAIVLIAINPNKQIAQARNVMRRSDSNNIAKAIEQYAIENGGVYPNGITGAYQDICPVGVSSNCINLNILAPNYIAKIPTDPSGGNYQVAISPINGKISVQASNSELGQQIAINPIIRKVEYLVVAGGGGGGGSFDSSVRSGANGGSGGGVSQGGGGSGGTSISGQGNNGGNNTATAGGGGGAGGTPGFSEGGLGLQSAITGTNIYYAGGGGSNFGPGGNGGGGNGATNTGVNAGNGTVNTGGGGGGSRGDSPNRTGGNGGSGIVIIRYRTDGSDGISPSSTGGTKTTSGAYTIHTFTSSGTFTIL